MEVVVFEFMNGFNALFFIWVLTVACLNFEGQVFGRYDLGVFNPELLPFPLDGSSCLLSSVERRIWRTDADFF